MIQGEKEKLEKLRELYGFLGTKLEKITAERKKLHKKIKRITRLMEREGNKIKE